MTKVINSFSEISDKYNRIYFRPMGRNARWALWL